MLLAELTRIESNMPKQEIRSKIWLLLKKLVSKPELLISKEHLKDSMSENSQWMTTKEAAEYLGYTPKHVRHLVAIGELSGQKMGRDYVVERRSVMNYLTRVGPEGQKRGRKPKAFSD